VKILVVHAYVSAKRVQASYDTARQQRITSFLLSGVPLAKMTIRTRRRPAVGVVICNRMAHLLSHLSPSYPVSSMTGPRRTRPGAHTLKFPVTTTYITHTCSTVQPPTPTPHARTCFFFLLFNVYALYPLIYRSCRSLLFYYIIASHSRRLSHFLICLHCAYPVCLDSYPGMILLLLFFSSFFCVLYNGRAPLFLLLSSLVWNCRRSN